MQQNILYKEITYTDPILVFDAFANDPWALLLDSADYEKHEKVNNRYSFIAVNPFIRFRCKNHKVRINDDVLHGNPFDILEEYFSNYQNQDTIDNLPPFQSGLAGYIGYDALQYLEEVPLPETDDINIPDICLGFYDEVISFDHLHKKAWIICSSFDHHKNLANTIHALEEKIAKTLRDKKPSENKSYLNALTSNFTKDDYLDAVDKTIRYIEQGDIFEANISQRFSGRLPCDLTSYKLYKRIRKLNPSPFSAYLNYPSHTIASASPERFLRLCGSTVETRPIKGTRPRGKTPQDDKRLADELVRSEKDRAENIMIVDLMRNDLSRVCNDDSVEVLKLCGLESFPSVHHLVSVVKGQLQDNKHALDLLRATFPGGSITGAPKIRAMEIISEIEPTQRAAYCGSIGYIGFNSEMDTSITIRTFIIRDDFVAIQAGGAIVSDSNTLEEYEETLAKAMPFKKVLLSEDGT